MNEHTRSKASDLQQNNVNIGTMMGTHTSKTAHEAQEKHFNIQPMIFNRETMTI